MTNSRIIDDSILCNHKIAKNVTSLNKSHYQRYIEQLVRDDMVPDGAVIDRDGKCRLNNQELRPRARCSECGIEQRFADISTIVSENTFGGKCWDCGQKNQYELVSFFAPTEKIKRRIIDQLHKNSTGHLLTIAKLLNVPLGN